MAKENSTGTISYYYLDHLGSTRAVDISGKITRLDYAPFGEDFRPTNERYKFTGKEDDFTTGLYYYNARYYDPAIGRFITEDPARDGINWYLYCRNNPLGYVDPTGKHYAGGLDIDYPEDFDPKDYVIEGDLENVISMKEILTVIELEGGTGAGLGLKANVLDLAEIGAIAYMDRVTFKFENGEFDVGSKISGSAKVGLLKGIEGLEGGIEYSAFNSVSKSRYFLTH